MGALMDPLAWNDISMGGVPGSIEVKLVDYKDAGYDTSSDPPQGEIWIRGDAVSSGYLSLEKETKESFTDDGWFKTGDVGEFDRDGNLKIIDRKKNLVKTLNGEYIALEKVRSSYHFSSAVTDNVSSSSQFTEQQPWSETFAFTLRPTSPSLSPLSSPTRACSKTLLNRTASVAAPWRSSSMTKSSMLSSSKRCKPKARRVACPA